MLLAIAAGGAAGSVLRYLVQQWFLRLGGTFPAGTLAVNVVGCFLIGVLARAFSTPGSDPLWRAALTIGFCGGFTTFSTFSAEVVTLVEEGRAASAFMYVTASVLVSIAATVAGLALGHRLFVPRS
jgi:CrcB protein